MMRRRRDRKDSPPQFSDSLLQGMSKEELIQLVKDMNHDWDLLNAIHNRRAERESWCGTYEGNQQRYNHRFRVLKLQSRARFAGVANARADSYARDLVSDSNMRDLIKPFYGRPFRDVTDYW